MILTPILVKNAITHGLDTLDTLEPMTALMLGLFIWEVVTILRIGNYRHEMNKDAFWICLTKRNYKLTKLLFQMALISSLPLTSEQIENVLKLIKSIPKKKVTTVVMPMGC